MGKLAKASFSPFFLPSLRHLPPSFSRPLIGWPTLEDLRRVFSRFPEAPAGILFTTCWCAGLLFEEMKTAMHLIFLAMHSSHYSLSTEKIFLEKSKFSSMNFDDFVGDTCISRKSS